MAGVKYRIYLRSKSQMFLHLYQNMVHTRGYGMKSQDRFSNIFVDDLKQLRRNSLLVTESQDRTVVNHVKEPYVKFSNHLRTMLDFTSMDHLSFQSNADVLNTYHKAMVADTLGRNLDYKTALKIELETELAGYHERPSCVFFSQVLDVERSLLRALNSEDDVIFFNKCNENSSYVTSSSVAHTVEFSHRDLEDLVKKLKKYESKRHKMILSDCVFPFRGNSAPLRDLVQIAQDHECLFVADDTYGVGIVGSQLRGSEESLMEYRRPFLLKKSLQHLLGLNAYGYLVGPSNLVDHISKLDIMEQYLDVPAPVMAVTLKVFSLLRKPEMKKMSDSVLTMADRFREKLEAVGYNIDECGLPLVSFRVGKESILDEFLDQLQDAGILCFAAKEPIVPQGESRLCMAITVHHTPQLIDSALQKILEVGSRLKLPRR